jgi:hypothetical protein
MTDWDHDTTLAPSQNEALLRTLLGKKLTRVARVMHGVEALEAAWREYAYERYGLPRSALFTTFEVATVVAAEDVEIYVAESEYMCTVTVERASVPGVQEVVNESQLLEATDPVFADGSCAIALGRSIEAIDVYRHVPDKIRELPPEEVTRFRYRPHEELVVFSLEGERSLGFSRRHLFTAPYRVSLNPVIDPGYYTRIARFE